MLKVILKQLLKRVQWVKQNMMLDAISTMEEFQRYIQLAQPETFSFYRNLSPSKRLDFQTVIEKLQIPVKGKNVLDIGPGFGDMLDICQEHGAKDIHFVEWDPLFYAYNRLKGFTKGYRVNHLRGLRKLESSRYDLIWAKGAIQTDTLLKYRWLFNIENWLTQIERIAAPGCRILVCPHWHADDSKRRIPDVLHNRFTEAMLQRGFTILDKIENHNAEPSFPITLFKAVGVHGGL